MQPRNRGRCLSNVAPVSMCLLSMCLVLAGNARGEEAAPGSASGDTLEEVTVTAQRKEESLQRVPLSVTAITADQLDKQKVFEQTDLQYSSPALTTVESGNANGLTYNIRASGQSYGGSAPGVQTYFDQLPITTGYFQLYDLSSVQVLKGPQGTLFGRNTTGGAVIFTPQKPADEFGGYGQASTGNFGYATGEGAVNIPVIDHAFDLRIAGNVTRRDGFVYDETTGTRQNGLNNQSVRISAVLRPVERLESYFVFNEYHEDTDGEAHVIQYFNPASEFGGGLGAIPTAALPLLGVTVPPVCKSTATALACTLALVAQQNAAGPSTTFGDNLSFSRQNNSVLEDVTSYTLDSVTLKNVIGYNRARAHLSFETDGSALPLLDETDVVTDTSTLVEELQAYGKAFSDKLDWLGGAYYELDETPHINYLQNVILLHLADQTNADTHHDTSKALYTHLTYDLSDLLHGLSAAVGGRETWDYRSARVFQGSLVPVPSITSGLLGDNNEVRFREPTYSFTLNEQLTPDAMIYVTSRHGYKSGGINSTSTGGGSVYQPEFVTDYELGGKTDWTLGSVVGRVDIALFTETYRDIQRLFLVATQAGLQTVTTNAAKASVNGMELEATILPFKDLELTGFWSYLHTKFDQYAAPDGTNLANDQFSFSPKNKISLTARYHLSFASNAGDPSVAATFYGQSEMALVDDQVDNPHGFQPQYHLWNFSFDWDDVLRKGFNLSLFVKNAFNASYLAGSNIDDEKITGLVVGLPADPRTYGLQFRVPFGASR
jgi:iron complex outermembrane recepter protein